MLGLTQVAEKSCATACTAPTKTGETCGGSSASQVRLPDYSACCFCRPGVKAPIPMYVFARGWLIRAIVVGLKPKHAVHYAPQPPRPAAHAQVYDLSMGFQDFADLGITYSGCYKDSATARAVPSLLAANATAASMTIQSWWVARLGTDGRPRTRAARGGGRVHARAAAGGAWRSGTARMPLPSHRQEAHVCLTLGGRS